MSTRQIVATSLQAAGALSISVGVARACFWAGVVTFGLALVGFGVAVERGKS